MAEIPAIYRHLIAEVDAETPDDDEPDVIVMPDVLTAKQVGEMLKIKTTSVYRYLQRGNMPEPIRLGRTLVWPRVVIEEWQESRILAHRIRPCLRAEELEREGKPKNPGRFRKAEPDIPAS